MVQYGIIQFINVVKITIFFWEILFRKMYNLFIFSVEALYEFYVIVLKFLLFTC